MRRRLSQGVALFLLAVLAGCGGSEDNAERGSGERANAQDSSEKPEVSGPRACEDSGDDFIGTCTDEGSAYHLLRKRDTAKLKELEASVESLDVEERANGVATITVKLTITNRTDEPQSVNASSQIGLLLSDKQYSPIEDSFVDAVQPDLSQTGTVTFEAPDRLAAKISDPKTDAVLAVLNFSELGAEGASEYAYFLLGR